MGNNYERMTKAELIKKFHAQEKKARPPAPKTAAVPYDRLVHDLQVHQEELEAQNQALREAQQLLEESRSRYAELYDLAPLGYVTLDGGGLVREINLTGAAMLGLERSRLIGAPFSRYVANEDKPVFREHLRCCQTETDLGVTEVHLNRKDGTTRHVELHSVPIQDRLRKTRGCLTALTDIAERKRMEQAVHESEALFRAIFAGAGIGMALADTTGRLRQTNPALQAMLGYTAKELGAMTFAEFTHPDDVSSDRAFHAELLAGKRKYYQIEKRYRRKDGQLLWGRLTASLIRDSQGEPLYAIRLVENITANKEADAEINQLQQDLVQRATELAMANQELESFSYSVSHDLRTPLASIDGYARVVLQDYGPQLPAGALRFLNLIHENALAMSRLIEDLLTFSRMSRQPLNKQSVATADLVRQALVKLSSSQSDRPAEIIIGDLPRCQADPTLLTQVWVNLLSNALKFTGKCSNAHIEIGSSDRENETVYFVKDNGVGFDMEQADRLFGVFQRLHAEEDYPGTGVGLAIVERIIRRHGGRVWAEAQVGRGACFYFTLAGGGERLHRSSS
jgi:PAS domain S-box-containing protein